MTKKSVARLVKDARVTMSPEDLTRMVALKNDLELKSSEAEAATSTWKLEVKKIFIKLGLQMETHTFCLSCGVGRRIEQDQAGRIVQCGCSGQPVEAV